MTGSGQTKALPCLAYANLVLASILKYSSTRLGKQLLANSGWEEKEICSKGVSNGQKEGQRRGDGAFPPPPTPSVHSNSKSNMASRINDRELVTLIPPHIIDHITPDRRERCQLHSA